MACFLCVLPHFSAATPRARVDNFWGANVDIAQLLPGNPLHVLTDRGDLFSVAELAGYNALRVTTFGEWWSGGRGVSYSASDWRQVGALAVQRHLTLIPVLGLSRKESTEVDARGDEAEKASRRTLAYQRKADLILGALAGTGCNVIIDLGNERELTPAQVNQFAQLAVFVRSKYPAVQITIGGWKAKRSNPQAGEASYVANYPDDGEPLADLVDVVSVHLYDEALQSHQTYGLYARSASQVPKAVVAYLARVQLWAKGKPILVSEFGSPNGVLPTRYRRDGGALDPQVQTATVDGVVDGISDAQQQGINVIGGLVWIMVPRGGDAAIHDESNEWSLSLIDRDRNALELFPAFWAFCRAKLSASAKCPTAYLRRIGLVTDATPKK
ncbi:hypothetical protein PQR12_04155 [Paraburkholderia nemoris]|uniref:cellulase family glycosylhydrolase n=1 Tax=Paraburkholderia nemoris TaxID=2793076 RepID=UPI0038B95584